jgi:hypothetical protein
MKMSVDNIDFKHDTLVVRNSWGVRGKLEEASIFLTKGKVKSESLFSDVYGKPHTIRLTIDSEHLKFFENHENESLLKDSAADPPSNLYKTNFMTMKNQESRLSSQLDYN